MPSPEMHYFPGDESLIRPLRFCQDTTNVELNISLDDGFI